jgi:hypothetical protein
MIHTHTKDDVTSVGVSILLQHHKWYVMCVMKVVAVTSEGKCESKPTKKRTAKDGCKSVRKGPKICA